MGGNWMKGLEIKKSKNFFRICDRVLGGCFSVDGEVERNVEKGRVGVWRSLSDAATR